MTWADAALSDVEKVSFLGDLIDRTLMSPRFVRERRGVVFPGARYGRAQRSAQLGQHAVLEGRQGIDLWGKQLPGLLGGHHLVGV